MSKIFEFKDKIERDKDSDFISFESLMLSHDIPKEEPVDPLMPFKEQQEAIRRETEDMLVKAKTEKKRIEEEAYQKGYARGEAEGLKDSKKAFDAKIRETVRLISSLEKERELVHRQYEKDLLVLVKTMVERLVGHEVSVNPRVITDCLQRAMQYVVEDSKVKVLLYADDIQHIKKMSLEDPSLLRGAGRIELVEDSAVTQGGCLLQTDFGEIDASLENCREKLFEIVDRAFLEALTLDGKE